MKLIHTAFEPEGQGPFPAIIAFHGWGASAFDLLGLAAYIGDGGFLMLCPQGPMEVPLGGAVGYGWYPISMGGARPVESNVEDTVAAASAFVDEAIARYPIDSRKLIVLGFSQGGVMAYNLAAPARAVCGAGRHLDLVPARSDAKGRQSRSPPAIADARYAWQRRPCNRGGPGAPIGGNPAFAKGAADLSRV